MSTAILSRLPRPKQGYLLAIDRTNWQFGRSDINFLVIAVIVRKSLHPPCLESLAAKDIHALTMDREFIGKQWLKWLDDQGVSYVVRIKKNVWVGKHTTEDRAKASGPNPQGRQIVFGCELFFE